MLSRVRYLAADVRYWLSRSRWRLVLTVVALVAVAAAGVGGYVIGSAEDGEGERDQAPLGPGPAPQIVVPEAPEPESSEELGFPAFATRNTTRVAGPDPVANAAGVALAVNPSAGGVEGPDAVTLVDSEDWHAGIAAASLVAAPVGAPILLTEGGEVPELTAAALAALDPSGSSATGGERAFAIGDAAAPDELEPRAVEGANPAVVAAEIEQLRTELAGDPNHLLLASSDEPALAMPAAGWAARSGDPVLYLQRDSIPRATMQALRRHRGVPVYVLGPQSAISDDVLDEVREVAPGVERVSGDDPVANAIQFARYADGSFGWNINDPGHGLVVARADEPLNAAAAAPLSASGTWGPLLLTDAADELPDRLRAYLLDLKPGYEDDPTRAVYNHVWVIGDAEAISIDVQAQVDDIAEVTRIDAEEPE